MSVSIQKSNHLKAIAILMMLCLHLFNRDYRGLFQPIFFIGEKPISYYISLFSDACVPIFAFVSGYGLYHKFKTKHSSFWTGNKLRLKKLYINYWIVLFLFAIGLGYLLKIPGLPGSWETLLGNISGMVVSYNGAWWFFTIYVFFVLTCRFWFKLLNQRKRPLVYFTVLLFLYVIGFYFRIYRSDIFSNPILHWLHTELALYFCTLFQFMLGAFALEYQWNERLIKKSSKIKNKNFLGLISIILLVGLHGLIPNFIVAPFTALGFIFIFLQLRVGQIGNRILDFFSLHSTNFWLIHMFFLSEPIRSIVYSFEWPLLIYIVTVIFCLLASYPVLYINRSLHKLLKI